MAAKKLVLPVVLILAITFAFKLSSSNEKKHAPEAEHKAAHAEAAAEAPVQPFFGECDPAESGLKFMSEEWAASHREKLEANLDSDGFPDCDRSACYDCHISAKPHDPGMQGNHITEYKQKRECYGCHMSPGKLAEGVTKCPGQKPVKGKTCLKCHEYSYCNECHQAMKRHKTKFPLEAIEEAAPETGAEAGKEGAETKEAGEKEKEAGEHKEEHKGAKKKPVIEYHSFAGHWDFLKDITSRSCSASGCHKQKFCNDCHTKNKMPALDHESRSAIQMHPIYVQHGMTADPEGKRPDCSTCHTEMYCAACHLKGETLHPAKWSGTGHAVRLGAIAEGAKVMAEDRCVDCHKADYCQKCHKTEGMMRSTHIEKWEDKHADEPESATYICNTCHSENYCNECHEIRLPHTAEFEKDHKVDAMTLPDTCAACHKTELCMSCHVRHAPKDHEEIEDYYKKHKEHAKAIQKPGPEMAEAMNIRKKRLDKKISAGKKIVESPKYCNLCHDETEYCGMCHKVSTAEIAHKDPDEWEKQHQKTTSLKELAGCAHCHKQSYCFEECHTENIEKQMAKIEEQKAAAPGTIPEEEIVEKDHRLCKNCHVDDDWTYSGEIACADCHEDITQENERSIHMSDCTGCHTPHSWKIEDKLVCARAGCHEDIPKKIAVEKHKEKANCADCHSSEKAHEWASAVKFSVCETCHRKPGAEEGMLYETDEKPISRLHDIDAHSRCGDCHDEHDSTVDDPKLCMDCHREDPLPKACLEDKKKTCTDITCHPFRAKDQPPAPPKKEKKEPEKKVEKKDAAKKVEAKPVKKHDVK